MIRARYLRHGLVPAIFSLAFLSGCSGSARVEGTITLDGQPMDGGTITFSTEGSGGQKASGEITGGKYSIDATHNLKSGNYRVEIYWFKKTGKQIPNKSDPGTTVEETKQVIPDEYNKNTKLKADIGSGSNTQNFELKSGGTISLPGGGSVGSKANDETQPNRR
jgi:hypothetical protein